MSLPDLFKKQGSLACLRPANIQQLGNRQDQAEEGKPQLLQRLEVGLQKAHAAQAHSSKWGANKLEVDACRQVFDMFISSMTTYRPLLLRIKQAYDAALEDAMGSAYDHVQLHTELSMMPHRHAEAVAAAKQQAEQSAAAMQEELLNKLHSLESQATQAEQECAEIDEQLHHYQKHILLARRELDQLDVSNRRAYKDMLDNSSWALLAQLSSSLNQGASSHVGKAYRMSC